MSKDDKKLIPRISTQDFTLQNYDDAYLGLVSGLGCASCLGSLLHAHAIGYCDEADMEPSFKTNWLNCGKGLLIMTESGWFHITEDMILDPERGVLECVVFEDKDYSYSDVNELKDAAERISDFKNFIESKSEAKE